MVAGIGAPGGGMGARLSLAEGDCFLSGFGMKHFYPCAFIEIEPTDYLVGGWSRGGERKRGEISTRSLLTLAEKFKCMYLCVYVPAALVKRNKELNFENTLPRYINVINLLSFGGSVVFSRRRNTFCK